MSQWQAKARVKGKMVRYRFSATSLERAQGVARWLFPRHKPNNIILTLIR